MRKFYKGCVTCSFRLYEVCVCVSRLVCVNVCVCLCVCWLFATLFTVANVATAGIPWKIWIYFVPLLHSPLSLTHFFSVSIFLYLILHGLPWPLTCTVCVLLLSTQSTSSSVTAVIIIFSWCHFIASHICAFTCYTQCHRAESSLKFITIIHLDEAGNKTPKFLVPHRLLK